MHRNQSVSTHQFAMVPRADIPRSAFRMETAHKTTFDAGQLVPIYVDEVLPGDVFRLKMTAFGRLATPIFPIMDNLILETFFFFVPNRLIWDNWQKFMGEQKQPGDSTDFVIPQIVSPVGGHAALSIYDYMGLPTVGQVDPTGTVSHSALPFRAYNLIWNEWFRDENLQGSVAQHTGDGPDPSTDYYVFRRGKRHDYFTSCLPWPQKGESVGLPLGELAPVRYKQIGGSGGVADGQFVAIFNNATPAALAEYTPAFPGTAGSDVSIGSNSPAYNMYADLSEATAATINQLRQAFQIQKLLERDARGGTRYTEIVRSHFGVLSPDARLQRPEYLGGGRTYVNISPVAQTSGSGAYTPSPQGNLAATGTVLANSQGFSQSFTEHGVIIGLAAVRADLNYQQGMRRMWSRRTRYDFYFPVFAALGEQAVLNKEIYCTGVPANDDGVFGYQERWAEYRYHPSQVTGLFRSTHPQPLDAWHLAQKFASLPTLNAQFIEDNPPVERIVAVGSAAAGQQFIVDMFFSINAVRPMPMYSVPGLIDHF